LNDKTNALCLQGDYVEKRYVKLLTVASVKEVKCILPLLFDSPSYYKSVYNTAFILYTVYIK